MQQGESLYWLILTILVLSNLEYKASMLALFGCLLSDLLRGVLHNNISLLARTPGLCFSFNMAKSPWKLMLQSSPG